MKRFLLAASVALILHVLLFAFVPGLPAKRIVDRRRPITVSLDMRPGEAPKMPPPAPAVNPEPEPPMPPADQVANHNDLPEEVPVKKVEEKVSSRPERPRRATVKTKATPSKRVSASRDSTREKEDPPAPPPEIHSQAEEAPSAGDAGVTAYPQETSPLSSDQGRQGGAGLAADVPAPTPGGVPAAMGTSPSGPPGEEVVRAIPAYRDNPKPDYPRMARRLGQEGTVILDVLVNTSGTVEDLRVQRSSGYPILDSAAMSSVKRWRFEPGRVGDRKVDMWVRIPVRFKLTGD